MSNHRETTTGTTVQGEMGLGARRTWWVRKQSKIHQGERRPLRGEVWAPRGPEQRGYPDWHRAAVALPSPRVPLSAFRTPWDRRKTGNESCRERVCQTTTLGTEGGTFCTPVGGPWLRCPRPLCLSLIYPQPSVSLRLDVLPAPRLPVSGRRSSWGDPHGKPRSVCTP